MKEEQLYICSRAKDPKCVNCTHSEPHEMQVLVGYRWGAEDRCTSWTECYDRDGVTVLFKVRCVKYHGE